MMSDSIATDTAPTTPAQALDEQIDKLKRTVVSTMMRAAFNAFACLIGLSSAIVIFSNELSGGYIGSVLVLKLALLGFALLNAIFVGYFTGQSLQLAAQLSALYTKTELQPPLPDTRGTD